MITNTFENSESFYSNSYTEETDIVLRDYVDIDFFLRNKRNAVNWDRLSEMIFSFNIEEIAGTVLNNFEIVFRKGSLPNEMDFVKRSESKWGINILDRIRNPCKAKESCLAVMRRDWYRKACRSTIVFSDSKDNYYSCSNLLQVKYSVTITNDMLVISLLLSQLFLDNRDFVCIQFRLFPNSNSYSYISYRAVCYFENDMLIARGRKLKRHPHGLMVKHDGSIALACIQEEHNDSYYRLYIPYNELEIDSVVSNLSFCFESKVFLKHYNELYFESGECEDLKLLTIA
jgi:hypothetical protein